MHIESVSDGFDDLNGQYCLITQIPSSISIIWYVFLGLIPQLVSIFIKLNNV